MMRASRTAGLKTKWFSRTIWVLLAVMLFAVMLFGDPLLYPRGAGSGSFLHVASDQGLGLPQSPRAGASISCGPATLSASTTAMSTPDPLSSSPPTQAPVSAWTYELRSLEIGGKKQRLHVLTADPAQVRIQPVLSFDRMFGFETLSAIDARYKAVASVNGWFSHSDGNPAALVFLGGRIFHSELNYGASVVIKDSSLLLAEAHSFSHLMYIPQESEKASVQALVLPQGAVFRVNPWPMTEGFAFYTREMGSTDRNEEPRLVGVVEQGMLRGFLRTAAPVDIPADGFLVCAKGADAEAFLESSVSPGDQLQMRTNLSYGTGPDQIIAYDAEAQMGKSGNSVSRNILPDIVEIGGWLVRDGQNVASTNDRYVGTMQNRAPRTAIGTFDDGRVLFLVADGRQGEFGIGLTGKELAEVLLELKVRDAALLDGGGNSQMMKDGVIVNSPSTGRERPMAFAFVLTDQD